ncbi:MAG: type II toxin-antitoxin system Phd/YefM family antitoxin [Myxococcota bacterium]
MAAAIKLSEDLRSITDLKRSASDVVDQVERTGRPVVLTRHGRGVAVLLSLEAFEQLEAASRRASLQGAVDAARKEHEAGKYVNSDEVDALLTTWEGRD